MKTGLMLALGVLAAATAMAQTDANQGQDKAKKTKPASTAAMQDTTNSAASNNAGSTGAEGTPTSQSGTGWNDNTESLGSAGSGFPTAKSDSVTSKPIGDMPAQTGTTTHSKNEAQPVGGKSSSAGNPTSPIVTTTASPDQTRPTNTDAGLNQQPKTDASTGTQGVEKSTAPPASSLTQTHDVKTNNIGAPAPSSVDNSPADANRDAQAAGRAELDKSGQATGANQNSAQDSTSNPK